MLEIMSRQNPTALVYQISFNSSYEITCAVLWEQYVGVNHGYLYQLDLDL